VAEGQLYNLYDALVKRFQLGWIVRVDLARFAVDAEFNLEELFLLIGHAKWEEE